MTPEAKAKALHKRYKGFIGWVDASEETKHDAAKQLSLIVVDEIFEAMKQDDIENQDCHWANSQQARYWGKVRTIIESM